MTSEPREADGGVYLSVRVQPRAKRNEIKAFERGVLRLRVTAPPVDNSANEAVIVLLASAMELPRRAIRLVRGIKGRDKLFFLDGVDLKYLTDAVGNCVYREGC